jgi:signal transduction histidine kinase
MPPGAAPNGRAGRPLYNDFDGLHHWFGPGSRHALAAPNRQMTAVWPFVVLLGAATIVLAWMAVRQQQLSHALHASRSEALGLADLLDVWQWQSDAQHRLVRLRPPRGSAAADWSAPPGLPLWQAFACHDEAALRLQLDHHAPLDDIAVSRADAAGAVQRGLLRGHVRCDTQGVFAGYAGTLRALSDAGVPAARAMAEPSVNAAAPSMALLESDQESFSYTVSHDLRAPIRVVEGFTKIVKEDYGRLLDRVGNDHLDRVLGAAARMNAMIDALLALSQLSARPLARQPVDLSQLAGYVAEDLRRQWPDRQVALHIEAGLQAQGDPTLLRVVLENLLGNAWKYTGKCAAPQVWFERQKVEGGGFTVRDNGAGFDMRFADRLFGVFQRLHSANDFQGTGVGLASVRRIVRRHGGEIWAAAEVDKGASFHFVLP